MTHLWNVLFSCCCHFLTEWSGFRARHSPGRWRGEWRDPYWWCGVRSSRWESPGRSEVWLDKRRPGELCWVTPGPLHFIEAASLHITSLKEAGGQWKDAQTVRSFKAGLLKNHLQKQKCLLADSPIKRQKCRLARFTNFHSSSFRTFFGDECTQLMWRCLLPPTGEMHVEHLGCHAVHPSVLDLRSGRLG